MDGDHHLPASGCGSAIDALIEAGITDAETVDFENPKFQEIFDAVEALPAIRTLWCVPSYSRSCEISWFSTGYSGRM